MASKGQEGTRLVCTSRGCWAKGSQPPEPQSLPARLPYTTTFSAQRHPEGAESSCSETLRQSQTDLARVYVAVWQLG